MVRKYLDNDGRSLITTRKQSDKQQKIANSKALSPEFSIRASSEKIGTFQTTIVDELATVLPRADDFMTALISG